ncbi:S16 family serine protease [Streptomyces sp. 549]|uniref:S16 family serine protease n=1 Tax=Streptomyces sp. 549 TaxID=3049076 RepID=UPI0024C24A30|nr:S16 family serine protease [Streptomyces sp. 549]MDK1473805.1 S16 family serine protease [Streptomyces sp. 549]
MTSSPRLRRGPALAVCAALVAALLAVAALVPLPYAVAQPGITTDVLGEDRGRPVITVTDADGGDGRTSEGELLMTTIAATGPDDPVRLPAVVRGWFSGQRAVMPLDAVYPVGGNVDEIRRHNTAEMRRSQDSAVQAALRRLELSPDEVEVRLRLEDVGGPSAGLMFTLGVIDKLEGDGSGGDLTGGRTVAGTGTIKADGTVGPVGGVPLKTQAARRDGATVFLVPEAECADAGAQLHEGLRLVPVTTLGGALDALAALRDGGPVPTC